MNFKIISIVLISVFALFSCVSKVKDIPLPEHPRPDFERQVWQNLNGYWQFKTDSADVGLSEKWQNLSGTFNRKILVPFSWACKLSEVKRPDIDIAWYSRTFVIEDFDQWKGKNTWLVVGASDYNTTIWVNGTKVGSHSGGYVPFDFNLSGFLQNGENKLVVRVEDKNIGNRPSGKQNYGNAKGIWQTVYLEARPENFISNIKFTPDIDNRKVEVEVRLSKESVSILKFSLNGNDNGIDFHDVIPANQSIVKYTVPIKNMKLWDLDNPYLYEVVASVSSEITTDEVSTYFGMRKISAMKVPGEDFQYVALNNIPVYLRMSLDQSYHPEGFYTFPSDQFMKEEIQRAKDLGLNGLRIHIKAEVPRKLYWADKLGLLIMEDIPNFGGDPDNTSKANWEYIAKREIQRDYNHPSIFSWVLFNETWGLNTKGKYLPENQEWVSQMYHRTKDSDPGRLVEDMSPANFDHVVTDLNSWHDYVPGSHWANLLDAWVSHTAPGEKHNFVEGKTQGNQPMFNSECGAVWAYSGSTGEIDITWEYHIMMNEFRKRPKIAGFIFTEFHDVISEWNGYYRLDRSKKIFGLDELCTGMTMSDFHKDLYVVAGEDFFQSYPGGTEIQIPVGISAVTSKISKGLKIKYSIVGWDELGEKFGQASGIIDANAQPFRFVSGPPVKFKTPEKSAVMVFATALEDQNGNVLQRNFVPFKVVGNEPKGPMTVTRSPADLTSAKWTMKQSAPQNGQKVWGMGSGYFEYEFALPANLNPEEVERIEFRAELASRYPQQKYFEQDEAIRLGLKSDSLTGKELGEKNRNSFPQTDEELFGSNVKIFANEELISEVRLSDDPADHRGILSWMNQVPGDKWVLKGENLKKAWYNSQKTRHNWFLDEAGSYGYLVKANLTEAAKKSAVKSHKITIRLQVDESDSHQGGLSVYGKNSGRYPLDLTILIKPKP